ncbi:unnamed protein product, partial [marine sediment metagenome]
SFSFSFARISSIIADSALTGARGNSGAILAQFFQGLAEATKGKVRLSTETFAQAATKAAEQARNAISNPQEGTIITVMKDWANHLAENAHHTPDFVELFKKSLSKAKDSLAKTPDKLMILKKEEKFLFDGYKEIQKECGQWMKDLSKCSYYEKKPTDFKDEEKHRKIRTVDVGGTAWGSTVHRILDYLVKEDPDEQLLSLHGERALEKQGISQKRKEELVGIVREFKKSDLYQRLKKAELKYSEVPFTINIEPAHPFYTELAGQDSRSVILSG